ncbi:CASTOR/POLLUX-related putative ion channel [Streptomyces anthocyanicus]|uniref:CASTOR/POLLUX-related putative ion channel n=1 Tax=Streptomyces anthocyanicus TaxID=68174 RepID=UPI0017875E2F|nr:NAD-binding lipoprotein [Streptomyces anthocyanicus]WTC12885.1 NAD-binding lipoprotein [Streptomyces anthocyanicus]GHA75190.1 lipoprotein [Streptomyces anthocyanicus]
MGRRRAVSWRHRARYAFDRTLARSTGALLGWLAACCLAIVVPVSTLLVWTDPRAPRSLTERLVAVWRTSAETLRLGGVTGAPLRMLLSVFLGLIALLCVSTLVGVITTGLGDRLEELRRGRSRVLEKGHAVVLGWSDQVFTVVGEMVISQVGRVRGAVAVLADRDSAVMASDLNAALGVTRGVRVVCRTGAPTDPAALALLTPAAAHCVLVLPGDDDAADAEVVRVLLALRALLGAGAGPPVVAAVRDERFLTAARLAAGTRGFVLDVESTAARLLVQAARHPGLVRALRDLLDLAGAEFHVVHAPDALGLTFAEISSRYEEACAVGYLAADGRALLTPASGARCGPGDLLIVVARDDRPPVAKREGTAVDPTVMAGRPARQRSFSKTLLLGWNRRAPLVMELLCRTAQPGSHLHVVSGADDGPATADAVGPTDDERVAVTYHVGEPSRPDTLRALDLFGYDSVIALAPDAGPHRARPDDKLLLTLLNLRALEEETGQALPVVAELTDHRSLALAPLGPEGDAVVRGELTSLVMTRIAQDTGMAAVFEELFAARGGALALRPASHYVLPGRVASFATVVASALRRGECVIGYRAHDARTPRREADVRLAPGKAERRVWSSSDEILVVTPPDADARCPGAASDERPARPARPDMLPEARQGREDRPARGPAPE